MYERLKASGNWEAYQRNFEPLKNYPDLRTFCEGATHWGKVNEAWENETL